MSGTAYFTICAGNYLPFARCLAESLASHHPGSVLEVWLVDDGPAPSSTRSDARLRSVGEAVSPKTLRELRFRYEVAELATACKPACFRHLFREGARRVVYLDPDTRLYAPLDAVDRLLDGGHMGLLTPHVLAPLPRDGAAPDDRVILASGIYNLGFLALAGGAATDGLLDWWWSWLQSHCYLDRAEGCFTDQEWMNLAPVFWPGLALLREPGYNVAYWNLSQRRLERAGDRFTVDGQPLTLFHFSGFDPGRPDRLSRYDTRTVVAADSPLARLLRDYVDALAALSGSDVELRPAATARFGDGTPFDRVAHRAYRDALRSGLSFPDPAAVGPGSLVDWLCGPLDGPPGETIDTPLTPYLLTLHRMRPELQRDFPDVFGADRSAFLRWVARHGIEEAGAGAELLERQLGLTARRVARAGFLERLRRGVALGTDEAVRLGLRVLPARYRPPLRRANTRFQRRLER